MFKFFVRMSKEHDPITLARIYRLAYNVLEDPVFTLLTIPLQHTHEYLDRSFPVTFTESTPGYELLRAEFTLFWVRMWNMYGLVVWNFDLFLQKDGRVAITNLEDTGFLHWNDITGKKTAFWISMPKEVELTSFFSTPAFPPDFYETVKDVEGISPVFSSLTCDCE